MSMLSHPGVQHHVMLSPYLRFDSLKCASVATALPTAGGWATDSSHQLQLRGHNESNKLVSWQTATAQGLQGAKRATRSITSAVCAWQLAVFKSSFALRGDRLQSLALNPELKPGGPGEKLEVWPPATVPGCSCWWNGRCCPVCHCRISRFLQKHSTSTGAHQTLGDNTLWTQQL